jgi:hypothetical protein
MSDVNFLACHAAWVAPRIFACAQEVRHKYYPLHQHDNGRYQENAGRLRLWQVWFAGLLLVGQPASGAGVTLEIV